jgi:hypothetical protein
MVLRDGLAARLKIKTVRSRAEQHNKDKTSGLVHLPHLSIPASSQDISRGSQGLENRLRKLPLKAAV